MTVDTGSRQERLLHAVLALSALAREGLDDLCLANRILTATADVFGRCEPRLVLVDAGHLRGFSPDPDPGLIDPLRNGSLEATPELVERLRAAGAGPLLGRWPEEALQAFDVDAPRALGAPLGGTHAANGWLVAHVHEGSDLDLEGLGLLAAQAATVLDNARLYRRLELEAHTDGLTGASNYRHFMRVLATEIDRAARSGADLAVIMVDVDNLKEYNDRFGHLGGSAALKELAELMRARTRSVDVVAKYGGDEFCLLLPDTGWEGARSLAERLRVAVAEHEFEGDSERRLTVSMGVAVHPDEGTDARSLLREADARLYEAKRSGRNRIGTRS